MEDNDALPPPAGSEVEQSPADTGNNGTGQETPAVDPAKPQTVDYANYKKKMDENKSLRERLKVYEQQEQAAKDANLSETDRLKKQLADAEKERDSLRTTYTETKLGKDVEKAAKTLKFADPDDALTFIRSKIEFDDTTGEATNLDILLKDLAKNKPYLLEQAPKPAPNAGSPTNPSRTAPLTKQSIARMTPDEINIRWDEVERVLSAKD